MNASILTSRRLFHWWLASATLLLLGATFHLWCPHNGWPAVPWLSAGRLIPEWGTAPLIFGLAGGVLSLLVVAPDRRLARFGLGLFAVTFTCLLLLNQHCTQPWAVHLVWTAWLLLLIPRGRVRPWLQAAVLIIYGWSAVSKLNSSFCTGLGRSFWSVLQQWAGQNPRFAGPPDPWLPLLFPAGELLVVLCLLWPVTRRYGVVAAVVMHALTAAILGPFGLHHQPGVLVWNGCFAVWVVLLFWPRETNAPDEVAPAGRRWAAWTLTLILALLPVAQFWNACDTWLAWGLYSSQGERLTVWLTPPGREKLPANEAAYLVEEFDADGQLRYRWRLELRSLQELHAPVYPQNRFQAGLVRGLARQFGLADDEVQCLWEAPANRWTGTRAALFLPDLTALAQHADRCWFNARPR